jgi:hypothetical protein
LKRACDFPGWLIVVSVQSSEVSFRSLLSLEFTEDSAEKIVADSGQDMSFQVFDQAVRTKYCHLDDEETISYYVIKQKRNISSREYIISTTMRSWTASLILVLMLKSKTFEFQN